MVVGEKIRQTEIITGILYLLQKKGIETMDTGLTNVVVKVATELTNECNRTRVYADAPMSSLQWLASDDTGLSSKYMHLVLMGACQEKNGSLPMDGSDFGRCVRMVESCGLQDHIDKMAGCSDGWSKIVANWEELVCLYKNNNGGQLFEFFSDL